MKDPIRVTGTVCRLAAWPLLAAAVGAMEPQRTDVRASRDASVADVGDVDGDGIADVLVAQRAAGTHEHAWILSGKNGAHLRTLVSPRTGESIGASVAGAGDVDLDGTPDVALTVADGDRESALVFSGKDAGVLLASPSYAPRLFHRLALAGGGDWDADGVPDLACYAPGEIVEVLSGKERASIARLELDGAGAVDVSRGSLCPSLDHARRAIAFARTGGADAHERLAIGIDGLLLLWSAGEPQERTWWNATATVVTGHNSALRAPIYGSEPIQIGGSTAVIGDIDGDRVPDLVSGMIDSGYATLSGACGTVLGARSYLRFDMTAEASCVDGAGDIDGDGRNEVLVCANEQEDNGFGPQFFEYGAAWVYSARDSGKWTDPPLVTLKFPARRAGAADPSASFGVDGCGPGDLDGDGLADLVLALHPLHGSWSRSIGPADSYADAGGKPVDEVFRELVRGYTTSPLVQVLWEVDVRALPTPSAAQPR